MEKLNGNEIKKFLKSKGVETKNISVKVRNTGLSDAIYCTLRDLALPRNKIQKILMENFEYYETDAASGEILSGGNTFAFADFDYELENAAYEVFLPIAEKTHNKAVAFWQKNHSWFDVCENKNYKISISQASDEAYIHILDKEKGTYNNFEYNIYRLARLLVFDNENNADEILMKVVD